MTTVSSSSASPRFLQRLGTAVGSYQEQVQKYLPEDVLQTVQQKTDVFETVEKKLSIETIQKLSLKELSKVLKSRLKARLAKFNVLIHFSQTYLNLQTAFEKHANVGKLKTWVCNELSNPQSKMAQGLSKDRAAKFLDEFKTLDIQKLDSRMAHRLRGLAHRAFRRESFAGVFKGWTKLARVFFP